MSSDTPPQEVEEFDQPTPVVVGNEDVSKEDDTMADTIDPQIDKQMQMNFANHNSQLDHTAQRFNDGSSYVAQESKQSFQHSTRLVGAEAANSLETHGLADLINQLKAAQNMPPNTNVQPS